MALVQKTEKDLIPFPYFQILDLFFGHPFQNPLIAGGKFSFIFRCRIQAHIFRQSISCDRICKLKSNKSPEVISFQSQSCLLLYLPEKTLLRAFSLFKMASHTNPFIFIYIIFLHHPVKHQVTVLLLNVTERCHHRRLFHLSQSFLLFISSSRDFCTFFLVTSTIFRGVISTTAAFTGSFLR